MRKTRRIIAFLLMLVMVIGCAAAEWKADINALMDVTEAPDFAEKIYPIQTGEGAANHTIACKMTIASIEYGFEFEFAQDGINVTDWSPVQSWLGGIVTTSVGTVGGNAEALTAEIADNIEASRRTADMGENMPIWADARLKLKRISVSSPFYPQLSLGQKSGETKQLQERLIVLGFLNDTADGYFGENTRRAVKDAQEYTRMLENEAIDKRELEATPTPVITATPSPTPTATPTATPVPTHELILVPKEQSTRYKVTQAPEVTVTPAPTAMPIAEDTDRLQPQTIVDGAADAQLQAFLYSWSFPVAHKEVANGASGKDVNRVQVRLNNLGYLSEEVDGMFGNSTYSAVMAFQRYNGLPETGVADIATQKVLFSVNAKQPRYKALAEGARGEDVTRLQEALLINGFSASKADGHYGSATRAAVERCQTYLNSTTDSKMPVNGIADPMLLDQLYSQGVPKTTQELKKGSKGEAVTRLQRRLNGLGFLEGNADGNYGEGTASAIARFQKQHRLTQTGIADTATLEVLYSERANKALKPYVLEVSIADQRVYAFSPDENGNYTILEKTMICSTGKSGSDTPTGTYVSTTGPGARWHYFTKFDCWAQYAYYIQGDIMFHSVLFGQKEGRVTQSSVNNLGRKASHGCVRLAVEDAEWIYRNCPKSTKVVIYNEKQSEHN